MDGSHGNKIVLIVDDINSNSTKICFCDYKSFPNTKIIQNLSNKLMSKRTTKLGKVYMDFWGLSSNIFLERDQYTIN